ncbi:MAG TPA: hypothetical protein PLB91_08670 [Spirochaetales bacterium]|nr:hypothetical protein [Spirochaetales bacterium]HRY53323.1 hypothetical protein [Spirochaetia bacterium]HRZ64701.1 hypothetical protein [Spirochaetia bacterium]
MSLLARAKAALLLLLALLAAAGLAAYLYLGSAGRAQARRIAELESLASRLTAGTVPARFMLLSREGGSLRFRLRLYDLAGAELALLEEELPGRELYLDFLLLPLPGQGPSESWLAFPFRLFTDELPAADGPRLFEAYDRGGFPAIFGGAEGSEAAGGSPAAREALVELFARAREAAELPPEPGKAAPGRGSRDRAYGSALHDVSALARFELGVTYRVVCRAKGGIEIMED